MRPTLPSLAVALLVFSCSSDQAAGGGAAGTGGAEAGGTPGASGGATRTGGADGSGGAVGNGGAGAGGRGTGGSTDTGGTTTGGGANDAGPTTEAGSGGKVSPVEGCQYQGIETTNCASGATKYWECGASTSTDSPDPSCVRPTTGPNIGTRWCCADPFCSKIGVVTQICSQVYPASPNGYSCDPDLSELSLCRKQAGNGACCPF